MTISGRIICISACFLGLLLISYLIGFFSSSLSPSSYEALALDLADQEQCKVAERHYAACLIQLVWRFYARAKRLEDYHSADISAFFRSMHSEEKIFLNLFVHAVKQFRIARSNRIEADHRVRERIELSHPHKSAASASVSSASTGDSMSSSSAVHPESMRRSLHKLHRRQQEIDEKLRVLLLLTSQMAERVMPGLGHSKLKTVESEDESDVSDEEDDDITTSDESEGQHHDDELPTDADEESVHAAAQAELESMRKAREERALQWQQRQSRRRPDEEKRSQSPTFRAPYSLARSALSQSLRRSHHFDEHDEDEGDGSASGAIRRSRSESGSRRTIASLLRQSTN